MPHVEPNREPRRSRAAAAYALMIAGTIAAFFGIREIGETLTAPPAVDAAAAAEPGRTGAHTDVVFHVLLALAAVVAVGRLLGKACGWIGQPPVIGQVIAGIVLGPSLLGRVAPDVADYVLPADVAPYLGVVAQLGIILYMFQVGLELNPELLRGRAHATLAVSHASIVVPFLAGAVMALWLYPGLAAGDVGFTPFALFLGVSMSITAFPVLARILADRGLAGTPLGIVALTCAATDDVTAWCLLALVVGVTQARVGDALLVIVWALAYIAVVFCVVRPAAAAFARDTDGRPLSQNRIAVVLLALLLSALATELIGIHAIFGAFLLGAVIPHDSVVARTLVGRLEDLVAVLFLPAFFALTGMRTEIGLLSTASDWLICGAIILVATAGKLGGTVIAARLTGQTWRDSAALGWLMNTRGLMELVVLNIGLDLGVISPRLFAMMVLMALATTVATAPALRLILGSDGQQRPGDGEQRGADGETALSQ